MDRFQLIREFRNQEERIGDVNAYQYMQENHATDLKTSQSNFRIVGEVPGVPVGMVFHSFYELMVVGIHGSKVHGIYGGQPPNGNKSIAISAVLKEKAPRNQAHGGDIILYGGEGGNPRATKPSEDLQDNDQKMVSGNAAMARSIQVGNAIRLIKETDAGYRYEGLYQAIGWESMIMEVSGAIAYNFTLRRMAEGMQ